MGSLWLAAAPLLMLVHAPAATPVPEAAQPGGPGYQVLAFAAVDPPPPRPPAEDGAVEESSELDAVLQRCTADRSWCAELVRDGDLWRLDLVQRLASVPIERRAHFDPPRQEVGSPFYSLWPHLVIEADGAVMVGLLASRRMGFSGGGALVTRLSLLRLAPNAAAPLEMLDVPVEGSALVRACFGEQDMEHRRGACHDDYQFRGTLTVAEPEAGGGLPRFRLSTTARTFPGEVSRWEDSAERPPLRRRDLVWWTDPACSYARTFAFDAAAGRYRPDAELPACDTYLEFDWLPSLWTIRPPGTR